MQSFSCILLCLCATFLIFYIDLSGFPWWLSSKDSACSAGDKEDVGWILGSARSPGGGNDNPLQYSCLKNPMDRGAWQTIVWRDTKSQMWQDTQSALICQFTYAHTHTHTSALYVRCGRGVYVCFTLPICGFFLRNFQYSIMEIKSY